MGVREVQTVPQPRRSTRALGSGLALHALLLAGAFAGTTFVGFFAHGFLRVHQTEFHAGLAIGGFLFVVFLAAIPAHVVQVVVDAFVADPLPSSIRGHRDVSVYLWVLCACACAVVAAEIHLTVDEARFRAEYASPGTPSFYERQRVAPFRGWSLLRNESRIWVND